MDVSDPQTLGFMVFGGFMVISAVGIALVSTLSMKETSYEEALAKQRSKLVQNQAQRSEKKKKDKTLEKKNKAKRKEDQPDSKLSEPGSDGSEEHVALTSTEPVSDPEPAAEPNVATEPESIPELEPEPTVVTAVESPSAPSPKDKKKKKTSRVEPASAMEVLVLAGSPVVDVSRVRVATEVTNEPSAAKTEPREMSSTKKKSKNKPEPEPVTDSAAASPLLSYADLLSTVSNMMLSDHEANKVIEVLNQKTGVHHGSWQLACQRGDPLSTLKKHLEEKEKLLTAKQDEANAANSRLQDLSKELGAEKSKMLSLEARLKAEQSARVQEVSSLRTKLQTAEQEHHKQTQQLNQKIQSLQKQLENGPNAQLARLQQENSILRDALNQATSQAESRQNAELARLRQDCVRLGRELTERSNALRADEDRRKSLEAKMAATEQELAQAKLVHADTERALQQRLDDACLQLKASQQGAAAVSELQETLKSREAELQDLKAQLENQVQVERPSEVEQFKISLQDRDKQVGALEAELKHLREKLHLLSTSQTQSVKPDEAAAADQTQKDESGSETESDQAFESLEADSQLLRLEEELQQIRDELHQAQNRSSELQEAFSAAECQREQREAELRAALTEAESRFVSLSSDFQASLQLLCPDVSVEVEQRKLLQHFTEKVQKIQTEVERSHSELQSRLKEAEQKQTELDLSRKLLQDTEAELHSLQRRCEEQEDVWKNKVSEAEQQNQTVLDQLKLLEDQVQSRRTDTENIQQLKEQLMLMEAQLEKQVEEAGFTQSCREELVQLQSQLQHMSVSLQVEQQQRQQLDKELQQSRQEVLELQQQLEAEHRSAAPLKEATVEVKEETSV